jgi:N-acetylmuramidase
MTETLQRELTDADFARAAKELNVEVAAIRAVAEVESAGAGILADGRPAILYEAHVFHKETGGKHANAKDRRGVKLSSPTWDRSLYGATGAAQHNRYEDARALNADAANKACSWGMFQILGQNHKACGFDNSQNFVDAMWTGGAPAHLDAFVKFIQANKLDGALRAKNWAAFAKGYNGPAYAQNQYDKKMASAYARWKAKG